MSVLFFYFLNMEKGKVPKEDASTGILYPTFMPTGIFAHSYVTLGMHVIQLVNLFHFAFLKMEGLFPVYHQLKK